MTERHDTEFDPDEDLIRCTGLDADDCYDIILEARLLDLPAMEARVEIERQHLLEYDDYVVTFTSDEVFQMGVQLLEAKHERRQRGDDHRIAVIEDLGDVFLENMSGETQIEIADRPVPKEKLRELRRDEQTIVEPGEGDQ